MPLTDFQATLAKLISKNRSEDSHLAGGAAIHIQPQSIRFSNDLDYFNDSDLRVAESFQKDQQTLKKSNYELEIEIRQPGYIRAIVSKAGQATKVEWAHDTAWRFMPAVKDERCGYILHPVDLAVNKLLALVGRNEARDFLDVLDLDERVLRLGALCWAASGKDPGLNPRSILELLRRRGKFQQDDFDRLQLVNKVNIVELRTKWMGLLDQADSFVASRPVEELGCLYYSMKEKRFYEPEPQAKRGRDYEPHFGRPGGILPIYS